MGVNNLRRVVTWRWNDWESHYNDYNETNFLKISDLSQRLWSYNLTALYKSIIIIYYYY